MDLMQIACLCWLILQAALEKGKNSEQALSGEIENEEALHVEDLVNGSESVKQLMSQMNELAVSANVTVITPPSDSTEGSNSGNPVQDIDKRIRALKKKVGFMHLAFRANTNDHIVHVSHFDIVLTLLLITKYILLSF